MPLLLLKSLAVILLGLASADPQAKNAKPKPKVKEKTMYGSFGPKRDGVGFVYLDGRIFVEALAIHEEVVVAGIFHLDTSTSTGCVLATHFAEKIKITGLGNVTLKFGDVELSHIKSTVLDRPGLQQIFKENTAVFQNRPISGVIGYPVVAARKTVIDFSTYTIRFPPPPVKKNGDEAAPKKPKKTAIAFRDDDRSIWLEALINGKESGIFLLSTGSPDSWIRKDVAEKTGIRKGKGPRSMKVGEVELAPVNVGMRIRKEVPEFPGLSFPVAGCLGCDFLKSYKITVDAASKRLLLERIKGKEKK
jgi:hypothetical protein